ncbi:hypothetical protein IFM89_024517 [Coptis chinensis]|uniref:Uncharacterized protein n=1 Tax=Coptis chinensis TaxID=261450 RepID=A0A835HN99_9MAGN|nr:hypothetical protein IFM89_024517 [Coptis chinensis]
MTLSIDSETFDDYYLLDPNAPGTKVVVGTLPFAYRTKYFSNSMKQKMGLENGESLSTCGTLVPISSQIDRYIHNENLKSGDEKKPCRNKGDRILLALIFRKNKISSLMPSRFPYSWEQRTEKDQSTPVRNQEFAASLALSSTEALATSDPRKVTESLSRQQNLIPKD